MANDAKLGLVLGVAIVIVIALVFFRQRAGRLRKMRPRRIRPRHANRTGASVITWCGL